MRYLSLTLSVLIVLFGLWLALRADSPAMPGPIIATADHVPAGAALMGTAASPPDDVHVSATLMPDGTSLGTDTTMEGDENQFEFQVPPGSSGKWILVVAVDQETGAQSAHRVDID